jgi:hypothetical protein
MKVGGRRNYGYGKTLAWAGKNALKDRYGKGHFATQAAHAARWAKFAEFAKREGIRDAGDVSREMVRAYASELASEVETKAMSVRYAQNLVSTVNVVLETMRGDRRVRLSPARLVGQRVNVRERAPASLDRRIVTERIAALEQHGQPCVAAVAALARNLGLRFREASLLDAREAHRQAVGTHRINVTRGTKGGRGKEVDRWVPVTPEGLISLVRAAALQENKENLLPEGASFRSWRDHAYGVWGRATDASALSGFHDLRVAYACERYETLTSAPAPVVAGKRIAGRDVDRAARAVIAQELGHGRVEVVAAYVGSAR